MKRIPRLKRRGKRLALQPRRQQTFLPGTAPWLSSNSCRFLFGSSGGFLLSVILGEKFGRGHLRCHHAQRVGSLYEGVWQQEEIPNQPIRAFAEGQAGLVSSLVGQQPQPQRASCLRIRLVHFFGCPSIFLVVDPNLNDPPFDLTCPKGSAANGASGCACQPGSHWAHGEEETRAASTIPCGEGGQVVCIAGFQANVHVGP